MPAAPAGPAVPDNLLDAWGAGWPYRQAFSSARSAMAALLRDRCVPPRLDAGLRVSGRRGGD